MISKLIKLSKKHSLILLFLVYLFSNLFLLLNNSLYGDDWVWTGNKFVDYLRYSRMLGNFHIRGIFNAIIYNSPSRLSRLLIFLLYFLTIIFFKKLLDKTITDKRFSFFLTLLLLIYPVVSSKYSLCISGYYLSLCEFTIASYLFICYPTKLSYRFFSLILFFLSFQLSSLLCFYAVPFTFAYNQTNGRKITFFKLKIFIRSNLFFIILPFAFFVIKSLFYHPLGTYSDYNQISLSNLFNTPTEILSSFCSILSFLFFSKTPIFMYLILILYLLYQNIKAKNKNNLFVLLFIFITFTFSILPYSIVGKTGDFSLRSDRHFFLTALPICLFLIFMFNSVFIKPTFFIFLILFSFMYTNLITGYRIYKDKLIGESLILNLSESTIIRDYRNFYFKENIHFDSSYKYLPNYSLNGHFWKAFGDEKRCAISINDSNSINHYYSIKDNLPYKIKDMVDTPITHTITMSINETNLTKTKVLKYILLDFIFHDNYEKAIHSIVSLDVQEFMNEDI